MGDFSTKVFAVVRRIPAGTVASYGQIGRMIGAPRAARYVGYALRANPTPGTGAEHIPCHRVVFKNGNLSEGFAFGGIDKQRALLQAEGVSFTEDGRVDMAACQWDERLDAGRFDESLPCAPPTDFDWQQELGDQR